MTTGFTSVYLFLYSIHFFVTKMAISGTASTFLFFGYTVMMVFGFFLITGKCWNPWLSLVYIFSW